jgi:prolyl oligopeptidase
MRKILVPAAMAMLASGSALAQTATVNNDRYIWLADKDSAKPLAWVEAENARTLPRLQNDPRYANFRAEALAIASAKDASRCPTSGSGGSINSGATPSIRTGCGAEPAKRIMPRRRRTGRSRSTSTRWQGRGQAMGVEGATSLQPEERVCLAAVRGRRDAVTYREFDLSTGEWVRAAQVEAGCRPG